MQQNCETPVVTVVLRVILCHPFLIIHVHGKVFDRLDITIVFDDYFANDLVNKVGDFS